MKKKIKWSKGSVTFSNYMKWINKWYSVSKATAQLLLSLPIYFLVIHINAYIHMYAYENINLSWLQYLIELSHIINDVWDAVC